MSNTFKNYILQPDEERMDLTQLVQGFDQNGQACEINVVEEQPLTIFLNGQEIVTAMTIGDYPEYLALGFLKNQGMLSDTENILGIEFYVTEKIDATHKFFKDFGVPTNDFTAYHFDDKTKFVKKV